MKVLVVTTKSAISVWEDHVAWMLPNFRFISPRTKLSDDELKLLRSDDDVLACVNWAQVRINLDLQKIKWTYVIADEAQNMCNRKAQQTKALKRIKALYRRALTGTPVINRPDDLWSILHWLYPKKFSSFWRFFNEFVEWVEEFTAHGSFKRVIGVKNVPQLRAILKEIAIRRKKKTVMPELPDKYYTVIKVDLDPKQRKAYDAMKEHALAWVGVGEDEPVPAPVAIAQLSRLRQFCVAHATAYEVKCPKCKGIGKFEGDNCPRCKGMKVVTQVDLQEPSSKLDAVMEIIQSTEESIVIFSEFSQTIDLLEARLGKAKVTYARVTGNVTGANRKRAIEAFQSGEARIFISTIKAGGAGITLTKASTVIFIDRSWSPAANDQAEDRLHRHGQKNAVQVVMIRARKTVDSTVESKLRFKRSIIRKILEDDDG